MVRAYDQSLKRVKTYRRAVAGARERYPVSKNAAIVFVRHTMKCSLHQAKIYVEHFCEGGQLSIVFDRK